MKTFRSCAILLVLNLKFSLAVDAKLFKEVNLLTPVRIRLLQNGNWQSIGKVGNHGNQETEMPLKSSEDRCTCPGSYRQNCACVDKPVYFQIPSKNGITDPNHDNKGVESVVNKRQGAWFGGIQKKQSYRHDTMIDSREAEPENEDNRNILQLMIDIFGDEFRRQLQEQLRQKADRPANS
ncbi:uncharacterized protein LOC125662843 [Ostrea edulis]|uniref:uncharacterized protein LOC125662843 n=1 Tax=Ostrea edulis TaxID=37623 RepID=UPI0024AFC735|nr:uncharacterized protein LOC125662843 [Ostrea edulis]